MRVVPEYDARYAREGRARNVHLRRFEIDEPPDAGHPQFQVRVVCEQGAMRARLRRTRCEVIAARARLRIDSRVRDVERLRVERRVREVGQFRNRRRARAGRRRVKCGIAERKERGLALGPERGVDIRAHRDVVPRIRERQHRRERHDDRIARGPGFGLVGEHAKLGRQGAVRDRGVDAGSERIEIGTLLAAERGELRVGDRADVDRARFDVVFDRRVSEDFGEPAGHETPVHVELKEAIAALQIAFGEIQIVIVLCPNVRDAARVPDDAHGGPDVEPGDRTGLLRAAGEHAEIRVAGECGDHEDQRHEREPEERGDAPQEGAAADARPARL